MCTFSGVAMGRGALSCKDGSQNFFKINENIGGGEDSRKSLEMF